VLRDLDKLEKALERAEERIALGEKQIADQKEILADLERAGQDTVQAKGLLVVFEARKKSTSRSGTYCGASGNRPSTKA
jgi:peptidoglycan hydrolase CwlO-like protein